MHHTKDEETPLKRLITCRPAANDTQWHSEGVWRRGQNVLMVCPQLQKKSEKQEKVVNYFAQLSLCERKDGTVFMQSNYGNSWWLLYTCHDFLQVTVRSTANSSQYISSYGCIKAKKHYLENFGINFGAPPRHWQPCPSLHLWIQTQIGVNNIVCKY